MELPEYVWLAEEVKIMPQKQEKNVGLYCFAYFDSADIDELQKLFSIPG